MTYANLNRGRHSAHILHAHIVFVTKYRRKVFGKLHLNAFTHHASQICKEDNVRLKECNGEADHVHLLIEFPPTIQLSNLVNRLKSVTSRRLRNEFIDLRAAYKGNVLWSRSYFIGSCGGAPLEVIKQYIQNQRG
jgi:putative transposase